MNKKYIWIGVVALVIGLGAYRYYNPDPQLKKEYEESINREKVEATKKAKLDSLILCYVRAEKTLKKAIKDPDSYEEIEKEHYFLKDPTAKKHIQVRIKYRAKNSFGGFVVDTQCFNFDKSLMLTEAYKCE